jgi:tetratricopeptide (TPR) repeat protein/transcriptional regulator with XRE-family HTH domain
LEQEKYLLRKGSEQVTQTGDTISSFGTVLKSFRKRRRLTQQRLAEAIGVHRSAIIRWEQGDFLPESKAMVLELARHLHLDDQESRHLLEASLTALSPHWLVPSPRNPFFTGRKEILAALHSQLCATQSVALTQSSAIHGLGGVGKTQIALEYAYRHSLEYSAVFWLGAETEEQIVSSLLRIADVLQLPKRDDKDQQRVIAEVQRWLTTHNQWLLIWDNIEDLSLLDRFLPAARSGTILITTRCQALGTFARGLDLSPMEHEEGILFLLRRAKVLAPESTHQQVRLFAAQVPAQYEAAADLVEAMGGLPLALDQAGAYLEETQCGLSAYLDLFRHQRAALLQQRGEKAREHPASVATTFTLAITATAQRHTAVWDLLRVCSLMQSDAIPEELFRQGAEHFGATLENVCRDELGWHRLIAAVGAYSLLSRQPEEQTFSLHRLVQAVLLDTMTETEREQWTLRAIKALDAVFPEVLTAHTAWKQCERLLPHILSCLNQARAAEESLALASLAFKAFQYLNERGQYLEAEPFGQQALRIQEQILGPEHSLVARSLDSLAMLYWERGHYTQAEALCERALHIREKILDPMHPDIATSLNTLGGLYRSRGKYKQAEIVCERALHIREQALGPTHPRVATSLNNLADLCQQQGKYKQAEALCERALHISEQEMGPTHPYTAARLNTLAGIFIEQERYEQAEVLCERALHISEQTLGSMHPDVAGMLNNLAYIHAQQGHSQQAEQLYQRALYIQEQTKGLGHPEGAGIFTRLAKLYVMQGKDEQAEVLYQRALQIWMQVFGPSHPHTALTLHDLALLRRKQGNLNEALTLAEQALKIRSQYLGDAHPKTIATRTLHTQFVQEQRHLEEEEPSSGQQAGPQTLHKIQEQLPIPTINVAVRGATEEVGYTRTVRMREVTFTCTICSQTVTQWHYPSGRIKYCSEACRTIKTAQMQEKRVARQREKRQRERVANLRTQQQDML